MQSLYWYTWPIVCSHRWTETTARNLHYSIQLSKTVPQCFQVISPLPLSSFFLLQLQFPRICKTTSTCPHRQQCTTQVKWTDAMTTLLCAAAPTRPFFVATENQLIFLLLYSSNVCLCLKPEPLHVVYIIQSRTIHVLKIPTNDNPYPSSMLPPLITKRVKSQFSLLKNLVIYSKDHSWKNTAPNYTANM